MIFVTLNVIKIFSRIFSRMSQEWKIAGINKLASQIINDFTKVLSRNIYFGTEFKKLWKFLPWKFEAVQ